MANKNTNSNSVFSTYSFCVLILFQLIISLVFQPIVESVGVEGVWLRSISSLFSVLAIFIVVLLYSKEEKESILEAIDCKKFNPIYIIPAIILPIGMIMGFGNVNDWFAGLFNVSAQTLDIKSVWDLIVLLIFVAVFPAVAEEAFFRGIFLENLKKMNTLVACLFTGLFFAVYHKNITQLIYQFIFGFLACVLTEKTGSEILAVISHFINNAVVLLFMFFNVNIDYHNFLIIIIGLVLIGIFCCFIFVKFSVRKNERGEIKRFMLPYGIVGIGICILFIVLNIVV